MVGKEITKPTNSNQPLTYQMEISAKEEQSRVRQGCAMGVISGKVVRGGLMGKDIPVETPGVEPCG